MHDSIPLPLPERGERLPLTPRQEQLLAIIKAWVAVRGEWPSIRDLAAACEPPVQINAITGVLDVLRRKGYVACYGARAWEILE